MEQPTLVADTTKLDDLKSLIDSKIDEIRSRKNDMYIILENIVRSGAWTGEAARTFLEKCKVSENDIENLLNFLGEYAKAIEVVSENANSLGQNISSICKEG